MHLSLTEHLSGERARRPRKRGILVTGVLVAFAQFLYAVRDVSIQSSKPAGIHWTRPSGRRDSLFYPGMSRWHLASTHVCALPNEDDERVVMNLPTRFV